MYILHIETVKDHWDEKLWISIYHVQLQELQLKQVFTHAHSDKNVKHQ